MSTSSRNKCYRVFLIIGSIFLVSIFTGCQNADLKTSETFLFQRYNTDLDTSKTFLLQADETPGKTLISEGVDGFTLIPEWAPSMDFVYGALISSEPTKLEPLLNKIPDKSTYETVVILAPTDHQTENYQMFTYSSAGILEEKGIRMDTETISEILEANIIQSLGEVNENSYWNRDFINMFPKHFPNAKYILVSINKEITYAKAETLAYGLKSYIPEKSIMLAVTDFEEFNEKNELIANFQKDFTYEILSSADFSRIDELPTESHVPGQVLGQYLTYKQAKKSELVGKQAIFKKTDQTSIPGVDTAPSPVSPDTGDVYLVSFGDVMIGRYVRHLMDANGLDYPFKKMDNSYLKVNDLLLANLEGPITTKAVRTTTGMNFGFFPDTAPILKKYHFDILSQANNHAFDKRKAAYEESFKYLKQQGIIPFGNPGEVTETSIGYTHIRGQKFAFLGLEEVNTKINDDDAVKKVKELVQKGYKVIVVPHWGLEYKHKPSARQKELGHKLIDAGAYMIIGHHPHVVQTIENYKGHPIIYSLGNAIFDQYWSAPTQEGLSVAIKMNDTKIEITLLPIKLPQSQMRLMTESENTAFINRFITWGDYTEEEITAIKNGKMIFTME